MTPERLDELALEIWEELSLSHADNGNPLVFARALFAAVEAEMVPVAWVIEREEHNIEGVSPILREIDYFNDEVDQLDVGTKLVPLPLIKEKS